MTHRVTRRKRAFGAFGLILLLFVVATACASNDPSPSVAPAGDASPPEAAAKAAAPSTPTAAPPTPAPRLVGAAPTTRASELTGTTQAPELTGTGQWINSEPFTLSDQMEKGRVVLVDFWTYTCINCIRTLPYMRDWHEKYADKGLVVLGVHTPEFPFEKVFEKRRRGRGGIRPEVCHRTG